MIEWILPIWLTATAMAITAGPMGCIMLWRHMAFFGDTLAHAMLMGVALGVMLDVAPILGSMMMALAIAAIIAASQRQGKLTGDSWLAVLSHGSLAIGLIMLSVIDHPTTGLMQALLGDLLASGWQEAALAIAIMAITLLVLWRWLWQPMVAICLHRSMAMAEAVPVHRAEACFALILALLVALAMQVVGILLTSAMLIIPAATARSFAQSPQQMAIISSVVGVVASTAGMAASLWWDIPTAPAMVAAALLLLIAGQCYIAANV